MSWTEFKSKIHDCSGTRGIIISKTWTEENGQKEFETDWILHDQKYRLSIEYCPFCGEELK